MAGLMGPICTPPVAVETLDPAAELTALLERAAVWSTIGELDTLCIAADPQDPPSLR